MDTSVQLSTKAWLVRGISMVPGELKLAEGRLCFTAFGHGQLWKWQLNNLERDTRQPGLARQMDAGESAVVFDYPLNVLEVDFPWYFFSVGLKVRANGIQYRFNLAGPVPVGEEAGQIVEAGQLGKTLRKALKK